MAARKTASASASSGGVAELIREAEAIAGGALAVFFTLSLLSYAADGPRSNLGGPVGHLLAGTVLEALGVAAYLLPAYLAYLTVALLRRDASGLVATRLVGAGLLVGCVGALGGLAVGGYQGTRGGGWLGGFFGTALRELVGGPGAALLLGVLLVLALALATGQSVFEVVRRAGAFGAGRLAALRPVVARGWQRLRTASAPMGDAAPVPARRLRKVVPVALEEAIEEGDEAGPAAPPPIIRGPERKPEAEKKRGRRPETQQEELFAEDNYRLPPVSLLDPVKHDVQPIDEAQLHSSARVLEQKLGEFQVVGRVVAVRPGPVITTYEFEPAPGVKVSKVVGLADDLTMALRAASVRILAPIPGKPVVGIEVSNPRRDKVFIRELLQSDLYRAGESKLTLALGKDTTGNGAVGDLARMPHLLIAGATGTGKSVSMNAMIMSVLYKASPRDVRMIMIDPKMLELSIYEAIPHLLVPVVTEPKKAAIALKNMVVEMERRYRLLHDKGVRNLDSYNRMIAESGEGGEVVEEPEERTDDADAPAEGGDVLVHGRLPRIVVIIDELADLMLTVGREIEESITRLAQKARAAGIHLILATQRPSVDVITGLIKANFPARISFATKSRVDSRTILDAIGAERLLGDGDMLFLPPGTARVQRLHGPFVSDADVHRVVDFIKRQEKPRYAMELLEGDDGEGEEGVDDEDLSDEMYDQAVALVTEHRQASISWLQRRLRVGYNRAARMIERMEREGVVSAASGTKGREVIARRIEA